MKYELPEGLSPREERAVIAALERYFATEEEDAWLLAGRVEATGQGALQVRRHTPHAWTDARIFPYTRPGTPRLLGRGDAR